MTSQGGTLTSRRIPSFLAVFLLASGPAAAARGGEILWEVEIGHNATTPPATVAPDGTIYTNSEDLYAIAPDGTVTWTATLFGAHAVGLGDDGTVYAGSGAAVSACDPAGTLLWTFTEVPQGGGFMAGPSVGPDGNVYVVTDTHVDGLGALSRTPDGVLRWNVAGFEDHQPFGIVNRPVPFASDRLYWAFDRVPDCDATGGVALELEGSIDWCADLAGYSGPEVGLDDRVHVSATDLRTYDPDGQLLWTASVLQPGEPAAGPDGAVFLFGDTYDLRAFEADGTERWTVPDAADGNWPVEPAVSPAGATVVFGTGLAFGQSGAIHAYDTATGTELWKVPLPRTTVGVAGPPAFSPDGEVVYLPVSDALAGRSQLVAVQVRNAPAPTLSAPDPGEVGVESCYEVTGATAGGRVGLFLAEDRGATALGPCVEDPALDGARRGDTATADPTGRATLCTVVPAQAAGEEVYAQAVDVDAPGCALSNVDATTYL